jgi:hypothetical protein
MTEVVEFTLPDGTAALRFVTEDPLLGEIWFRAGLSLQVLVSAYDREFQDVWIRDLAAGLTFSDPADIPAPYPT